MFLKFIKELSVKRVLNNCSAIINTTKLEKEIQTIGILIDETAFMKKDEVIQSLVNNGFSKEKIFFLAFKNYYNKKEERSYSHFSFKDFSLLGTIESQEVKDFIAKDFDLLINYYDNKKSPLLLVTHLSKATFKVGFVSVNFRHNHLLIDTKLENHHLFINEMFKYLRILNKI
jgi:hypothetical protein